MAMTLVSEASTKQVQDMEYIHARTKRGQETTKLFSHRTEVLGHLLYHVVPLTKSSVALSHQDSISTKSISSPSLEWISHHVQVRKDYQGSDKITKSFM